jgi:hypothetical protein
MRTLMSLARTASIGAAVALGAAQAAAQEGATQCELNPEARPTTRFSAITNPATGSQDLFVGGGAVVRCPSRGITLSSDSAEYYGNRQVWYLIGAVRYREPRLSLDSQRATYWTSEERLLAQGNVVTRLSSGTTMRGPQMEYFRAVPGLRERARMIATGRPHFELVQTDSAGRAQDPVGLDADRVVMDGDSLVYAGGDVEITRPDVEATGDSAVIDSGREWARLMRSPRIVSTGDEPFTLQGTVIDLFSRERKLQRVLASGAGVIDSEDLNLRSDTIDLRMANDQLQRAHAWGASRARAISEGSDILADSLDVFLPNQRLTEVRAIGDAFAQSAPDTSRVRTVERDWMRGDSIVARFDTLVRTRGAAARDTGAVSELRELLAEGNSRSYYQLAPEDTSEVRPSVNFVTGRRILVSFRDGEVRAVRVDGQTYGVLLQPSRVAPRDAAGQPPSAPSGTSPVSTPPPPGGRR